MHSSRMHTARSSSRPGGLQQAPLGPGTHPGPCTPPRTGTHPRDQAPPIPGTPNGTRHPSQSQAPPPPGPDPPPVDRHTPVNILPCPKLRLREVKSKDHVSCMCLAGAVAASWYITQHVAGSSPFTMMTNIFVTEFSQTFRENSNIIWGYSREYIFCEISISRFLFIIHKNN